MNKRYFAVIDLGSNSFNLIIARTDGLFRTILKRFNITVQLAKYLQEDQSLSQEGIASCCKALATFQEFLAPFGADIQVRATATYTIRQATNSSELLEAIAQVFPHKINIISGEEEAKNIFRGISLSFPTKEKYIAMDIGGGSTEIIFSEDLRPKYLTSQNLGCVVFSKKFFPNGEITKERFEQAFQHAMEIFAPVRAKAQELGFLGLDLAVGSSGTIKTAISQITQKFCDSEELMSAAINNSSYSPEYKAFLKTQLNTIKTFNEFKNSMPQLKSQIPSLIEDLTSKLANPSLAPEAKKFLEDKLDIAEAMASEPQCQNYNDRIHVLEIDVLCELVSSFSNNQELIDFGFDPRSRQVVVGGLAILKALFYSFEFKFLTYSDTALREGVLFSGLEPEKLPEYRLETLKQLANKYQVDAIVLDDMIKQVELLLQRNSIAYRGTQDVTEICLFYMLGLYVGENNIAATSKQILAGTNLIGYSQKEKERFLKIINICDSLSFAPEDLPLADIAACVMVGYNLALSDFATQLAKQPVIPERGFNNPISGSRFNLDMGLINSNPTYKRLFQGLEKKLNTLFKPKN